MACKPALGVADGCIWPLSPPGRVARHSCVDAAAPMIRWAVSNFGRVWQRRSTQIVTCGSAQCFTVCSVATVSCRPQPAQARCRGMLLTAGDDDYDGTFAYILCLVLSRVGPVH